MPERKGRLFKRRYDFFQANPDADKTLAKLRAQLVREMPEGWRWDHEIGEKLSQLQSRLTGLEILWPATDAYISGRMGRENFLSNDDLAHLKFLMDEPTTTTIVIPQNTGNHWYPICLQKHAQDQWNAYALQTKTDGSCGDDLVVQAEQFARHGARHYVEKGGSLSAAFTSEVAKASLISLSEITRFDFQLARLADYEMLLSQWVERQDSSGAQQRCQAVIDQCKSDLLEMLGKMDIDTSNQTINRLYESGLDKKPSISGIINQFGFVA
ncbi:hypothetical protein [Candidiatus Paracoxiella cheracis]|uniref:hypothetical protein n=1 Tax=Candidiatus Paracoxiella cheracis TaxID=3405120 RepID=UPI003BF5099C